MRREIADLVFCFKAIHGQVQIPSDLFAWSVTGRCLRTTDDLKLAVPFSRNDVFKHSYFVRITRLWNSLPYTVPGLENIFVFLAAKSKNKNFLCKSIIRLPAS